MGDGLKLPKDKRHRSTSSLSGVVLDGTRSERKLDIRASIQEVDDQFTVAEARCNDLQEKINLLRVLKKKRKLKKRSLTRVADSLPISENIPFISVRTQPKKKGSQQTAKLRRLEVTNPTRGYLDPVTMEQHQMIGQVRGCNREQRHRSAELQASMRVRARRTRADGDAMTSCDAVYHDMGVEVTSNSPAEVACGDDDVNSGFSDHEMYHHHKKISVTSKRQGHTQHLGKLPPTVASQRKRLPRERALPTKEVAMKQQLDSSRDDAMGQRQSGSPLLRRQLPNKQIANTGISGEGRGVEVAACAYTEERPVVELFSKTKARFVPQMEMCNRIARNYPQSEEHQDTGPLYESILPEPKKERNRHPRRVKYRSRRYELPTVASQMKQAGMRYYYEKANSTNIPFVASKSTAPSHNIGVNIQQVLNGVKIQQPLSGIPLTIAHHMGLGHIPTNGTKSTEMRPSLDHYEINVIKLGSRLLRLPSYRYMSYSRLLSLYREGDGMVPRFLRAISRPHYFYTSMYNLSTHRDDHDGATSKGRGGQETKQSLAEYAGLYRELEQVEQCIKEGNYDPELECRREELTKELAAREEHIRRVVKEYRSNDLDQATLRASASTADDTYRHSTFRMNLGDHPQ